MPHSDLHLGTTAGGEEFILPYKLRTLHVLLTGPSGKGKTNLFEHMIRQDVENRDGLCFIDPHGEAYEALARWLATHRYHEKRKIVLIDPTDETRPVGFNPLYIRPGASQAEISRIVDFTLNVCARNEDVNAMPTYRRAMRSLLYALAVRGLTLADAHLLLDQEDAAGVREYATQNLENEAVAQQWEEFNNPRVFPRNELRAFFQSTNSRVFDFVFSPLIMNMIGQTQNVVNFRQLMDEGAIVLVKLSGLSALQRQMLGGLIISDIHVKALSREDTPKEKRRPFYLYIDECYDFINEDIGEILTGTRKFGLHLLLSHQNLGQIKRAGEAVYDSIMEGAQTKMVYGGLTRGAEEFVDEMFTSFDLQEAKPAFIRKVVTGHKVVQFKSGSVAEGTSDSLTVSNTTGESLAHTLGVQESQAQGISIGESESEAEGLSWSRGQVEGLAISQTSAADGLMLPTGMLEQTQTQSQSNSSSEASAGSSVRGWSKSLVRSHAKAHGQSESVSRTRSQSTSIGASHTKNKTLSEGFTEGLMPIEEEIMTKEYSLEEQRQRARSSLVEQGVGEIAVKIPEAKKPVWVKSPLVEPGYARDSRVADFKKQVLLKSGVTTPKEEVVERRTKRRKDLIDKAKAQRTPPQVKKNRG